MSSSRHILTFTLSNLLFAVDSLSVKEIIWLPALTPVEEVPPYISGVLNLREKIVSVVDLRVRFGHSPERYHLSDKVIILSAESRVLSAEIKSEIQNPKSEIEYGIIVNDVHDVVGIPESDIEPAPSYGKKDIHPHFVSGEVKVGEEIIMLLNHKMIISAEFGLRNAELETLPIEHLALSTPHSAFEGFSPEDMAIFHQRAISLMQPSESLAPANQIPLSVVSLNGEYYGVSLDTVKEFSEMRDITPVPCTPPHIVGDMNLRGDILTIVDIRGMLNLSSAELGMRNSELKALISQSAIHIPHLKKVIVAHINDLLVGVTVDDVLEVLNISPLEFRPVPAAVSDISHEYIKGEFPYNEKMLSVLDLKKILTNKELVVDEKA
ncbi:MAG: purine-binding chemotaxis protein CheW [Nitrospinae bacterium]|nr:purine-binding chemotaxis protein CheW [Nitrospinota bacterium]